MRKAVGAKVLLIEAGAGGTTCAQYGCMPSKLLLTAARAARDAKAAKMFGVHAGDLNVNGKAVMTRVRRERDHFVEAVLEDVAAIPPADRLHGRARFAGPDTLTVDDHTLVTARAVVIATGARPVVPADLRPGFAGTPEQLEARIQEFEAAGVDLLLLQMSPQEEEMERFGAQVIRRSQVA